MPPSFFSSRRLAYIIEEYTCFVNLFLPFPVVVKEVDDDASAAIPLKEAVWSTR